LVAPWVPAGRRTAAGSENMSSTRLAWQRRRWPVRTAPAAAGSPCPVDESLLLRLEAPEARPEPRL